MSPLSLLTLSSASRSSSMSCSWAASARSRSASAASSSIRLALQLELRFGLTAQRVEGLDLLGRQRPRHLVDDAQRAERVALRRDERGAGVEADAVFGGDEGVVAERRVAAGIRHDVQIPLLDGVRAERQASRRFRDR